VNNPANNKLISSYLTYIKYNDGIECSFQSLERILFLHQTKFNFETATKINDKLKSIYFSAENALQNIITTGYGGTCFSSTLILHEIFTNMNLCPQFLHLKPDHFALAISFENEWYYVDVSFWAPLFKLYPLREDWETELNGLKISWNYDPHSDSAKLLRNGQVAKQWNGEYSNIQHLLDLWNKSLISKNFFNTTLIINRWLDRENFVFLKERAYRITSGARVLEEKTLNNSELSNFVVDTFQVDPQIYMKTLNSIEYIKR